MKLNSDDVWPPGFRFHPTDEELVVYYLKKKICKRKMKLGVIAETDVYKWDPEELPGQSLLKTGDRQWFFFSPRDRKYPNGARSNRATQFGYWKATGKDRTITCSSRNVGVKKTLVFYRGRAPNGERTDWVMHEYTLDEEELKRCQNIQDYYALYKVFKKSGAGPKNGEQYGAPFIEEDWNDDECLDVAKTVDPEIPAKQLNEVDPVDSVRANGQVPSILDEIIKNFPDDPVPAEPQINPQGFGEEEAHSALLNTSSRAVIFPNPDSVYDEQASFDFTQSASSHLPYEASEVTSALENCEQVLQLCEEDFLEMDDLIGPEPTTSAVEKPVESLQFDQYNGLSELELYHDAAMFLHDMGPIDQETIMSALANDQFQPHSAVNQGDYQFQPHSLVNRADHQLQQNFVLNQVDYQYQSNSLVNQLDHQLQQNFVLNQVDYQYQSNSLVNQLDHQLQPNLVVNQVDYQYQSNSVVNQLDHQLQPNLVLNQVDYQLHSHSAGADHISSQQWMHDLQSNILTPAESTQGILSPPTSGIVQEFSQPQAEANQNQNQNRQEGGGEKSWFSSSLWDFVESIPTTPASAAETPLMNRAFERMSSFSRVRLNARNTNVAGGENAVTRRQAGSNRGFLILSILGALCAILWMLMGNVRVLGRCISS